MTFPCLRFFFRKWTKVGKVGWQNCRMNLAGRRSQGRLSFKMAGREKFGPACYDVSRIGRNFLRKIDRFSLNYCVSLDYGS